MLILRPRSARASQVLAAEAASAMGIDVADAGDVQGVNRLFLTNFTTFLTEIIIIRGIYGHEQRLLRRLLS